MQIRRIDIRDFRKITRREIVGLSDGLNVVVGDNEAGKSTMLAALRAAFFERHRLGGKPAEAMLPYGSAVRPTVAVDFELDGKPWSLVKSFVQRPEASLQGPGERHAGDAVEERLAELFGFTPPGRGGSDPGEHHGTHGLLWVEQGLRSNLGVGAGRDTLAGALEREVGQVTGGERGRALLAAAEERRERFWDKRERPRGPVLEARRHVEDLEAERATLMQRQRDMEERLLRLDTVGGRLERHRRDDHLGRAVTAVGAASRAVAETARRETARQAAATAVRDCERILSDARERCARRQALVAKREAARVGVDKADTLAGEAQLVARTRALAAAEADGRLSAARKAQDAAATRFQAHDAAVRRREAETALRDLEAKLAAAEEQAGRHRDAAARATTGTLDAEALMTLTTLERAADKARAELDAASLQITFEPDGERHVAVDGTAHAASLPLRLTRDAILDLEGFGRLNLQPGGGAAELARRSETADRALNEALARHAIASLSEARRLVQARAEAQADAAALAKALAVLAPKGLDALRKAVGEARARVGQETGPAMADPLDTNATAQLRRDFEAYRAAALAAEQDGRTVFAAHQVAITETATVTERRDNARRQLEALADELAVARSAADDDLLGLRQSTAEAALAQAQATLATAGADLAAADVEAAQLALERAETAEREIRRDLTNLEAEHRDLRVELRAVGQDGVSERLSAVEEELAVARTRLAATEREAAASRLLHETLLSAQRESKERWLGPVLARVAPYLRLIHPDSEIRIDDRTLEIEGLFRSGVLEDFGALSMGAREQVAVVTRLALADILRGAGHPAAVILDDALVNTDDARLERMRNVLTRAARGLQILIFTCRERDFLGLGTTHRI